MMIPTPRQCRLLTMVGGLTALFLGLSPGSAASAQKGAPRVQSAPAPAARPARRASDLRVGFGVEAGWRWVALGQESIPRDPDTFSMAFHGAAGLQIGGTSGGLYTLARFDGYAPTGLGTVPWTGQLRVGYFRNVNYFDPGGLRSSTYTTYEGTSCGAVYCYDHYRERTSTWWEPAGWVSGLRYFYAAGHFYDGTEVENGATETQQAGAVGAGLGFVETKFTTWFFETEVLYFPERQWRDPDRSAWGWWLRMGALFGPVFVDLTILLDPAIGGELSVGAGFLIGG